MNFPEELCKEEIFEETEDTQDESPDASGEKNFEIMQKDTDKRQKKGFIRNLIYAWRTLDLLTTIGIKLPKMGKRFFLRMHYYFKMNKKIAHRLSGRLTKKQRKNLKKIIKDRSFRRIVKNYAKDTRVKIAAYKRILVKLQSFDTISKQVYIDAYKEEYETTHKKPGYRRFKGIDDYETAKKIALKKLEKRNREILVFDYGETADDEFYAEFKVRDAKYKKRTGKELFPSQVDYQRYTKLYGAENPHENDRNAQYNKQRLKAKKYTMSPSAALRFYYNKLERIGLDKIRKSFEVSKATATPEEYEFDPKQFDIRLFLKVYKSEKDLFFLTDREIRNNLGQLEDMWRRIIIANPKIVKSYSFYMDEDRISSRGGPQAHAGGRKIGKEREEDSISEDEEVSLVRDIPEMPGVLQVKDPVTGELKSYRSARKAKDKELKKAEIDFSRKPIPKMLYLLKGYNHPLTAAYLQKLREVSKTSIKSDFLYIKKLIANSITSLKNRYVLSGKEEKALDLYKMQESGEFKIEKIDDETRVQAEELQKHLMKLNRQFINKVREELGEDKFNQLRKAKIIDYFDLNRTVEKEFFIK